MGYLIAGDANLETELLGDLKQNLRKIRHHGHRASSIVKGMLEHSRKSTGTKEPTNLNALCDEYLRLAYHGLRAREKHGSTGRFNCELKINLDPAIGTVNLIQQDMSRVLLNLSSNAFYAVFND
jgi:two-component system NtrC family sensor kinase